MLGVPTTAVTKVQDLDEVDTQGKLVFQTSDGYNVVQPSKHNFDSLIKLGYVPLFAIDCLAFVCQLTWMPHTLYFYLFYLFIWK